MSERPAATGSTGGRTAPEKRDAPGRRLIVNADDFGRSRGVNLGVIRGHEHGIVTSASLMVRWPDAAAAAAYARRSALAVGLHFDLGEWVFADGEWRPRYEVLRHPEPETVAAELERQLELFVDLVGSTPTHLDSHQHVHLQQPTRRAIRALGKRLGVPVRGCSPEIAYSGAFFGQDGRGTPVPESITTTALVAAIEGLASGTTELGCHPAEAADHESAYAEERLRELDALCDPRVREALVRCGAELLSFADL